MSLLQNDPTLSALPPHTSEVSTTQAPLTSQNNSNTASLTRPHSRSQTQTVVCLRSGVRRVASVSSTPTPQLTPQHVPHQRSAVDIPISPPDASDMHMMHETSSGVATSPLSGSSDPLSPISASNTQLQYSQSPLTGSHNSRHCDF